MGDVSALPPLIALKVSNIVSLFDEIIQELSTEPELITTVCTTLVEKFTEQLSEKSTSAISGGAHDNASQKTSSKKSSGGASTLSSEKSSNNTSVFLCETLPLSDGADSSFSNNSSVLSEDLSKNDSNSKCLSRHAQCCNVKSRGKDISELPSGGKQHSFKKSVEPAFRRADLTHQASLKIAAYKKPKPRTLKGMWINIWPCFGTHASIFSTARRTFVRSYDCHVEDITEKVAMELKCQPAPTALYEPQGRVVRSVKELRPEGHYLLFPSAGFYRRECVPVALLRILVASGEEAMAADS